MEVLLAAGAGMSAWAATIVASGGVAPSCGLAARHALRWGMRALRLLRRLGSTTLAEVLLSLEPWRGRSRALVAALASRGVELDEGSAAIVLGCGLVALATATTLLMASPVAGVAAVVVAAALAVGRDAARRRRERREVTAAMPGVYRTLSVALASGQTRAQAVS